MGRIADFKMSQRVTLRKRQPYVTRGHKRRRIIRTPGGKYVYQHLKKLGTKPKCGDCGDPLQGVWIRSCIDWGKVLKATRC